MQDFVTFWGDFLPIVCDFLLSDPIIWFIGILISIFVASFVRKLIFR